VKKFCNFCGAPLKDSAKECEQCGWDRSQDGAPSSDPADTKARIRVAVGLVVAYAVMGFLIQGAPDVARATPAANTPLYAAPEPSPEPSGQPAVVQAITVGAPPPTVAGAPVTAAAARKPLVIKVADDKAAHIEAHSALSYDFEVPETGQKCQLLGQLHGSGGFDSRLETFLLTDDEYLFWHANPAAIPHSSWDTIRGSETSLSYELPGAGTYHLVISSEMSPTSKTVQVKAQVKCAK
jgi:hypothetical protein